MVTNTSISASKAQTYAYPDGTQSTSPPSDGQVFIEWDHNKKPKRTWQYDDLLKQWFDIHNLSSEAEFDLVKEFERLIGEGHKCECGSDKVGSPKHSTWCPKHTR